MKRTITAALACVLLCPTLFASVGSHDADYVGGTITSIKVGTEGKVSADNPNEYVFKYKKGDLKIPYERVEALEYGEKAGRRLGLALAVNPLLLLSTKRKHFLTISWKDDDDKDQAVVLELGKDIVRVQLATIQARTGRKVEYQDDEARKYGAGGM